MTDAFDQWREWDEKPPGDRRSIPVELYHAVMRLPEGERLEREKVNTVASRTEKTVWIYEDGRKRIGDLDWVKVFSTQEAANRWLAENDPEGVAWAYPIEPEI